MKKKTVRKETLKPKIATQAWLRRGLTDFFVAFQLDYLVDFRAFALHQGIEKCSKAYLIASKRSEYEFLSSDMAAAWIEKFAKDLRHDLASLVGRVAATVHELSTIDPKFLDLLDRAYEEGRYPTPWSKSIWTSHGYPALVSDKTDREAFRVGCQLYEAIDRDFGFAMPLTEPVYQQMPRTDWDRFVRIFSHRGKGVSGVV